MKRFFLVALFIVIPLFAAADFTASKWQYERPIVLPSQSEQGYVRMKLDRAVAAGSFGFKDVRVIEGESREVPYQFSVETAEVRAQYLASEVLDTVVDSSGRLEFILDLGQSGILHSKLHIETASLNYKRQVSVFAAPELLPHSSSSWNLLTDKGYIFKFTDPVTKFSTDSGEVAYPQNSSRYIRVVIENGPEGALSLQRGSVYRYEISSAKEETETLPADILERKNEQTTEVVVDMGAAGIPTHTIRLFVNDRGNFSRSAYLFGSADGQSWSRVGQGYLSRIETAKWSGGNLSIDYPESTYRFYKVSIQNFDDAPLDVASHVEVTHILRTVVFEAEGGKSYRLYYGNPAAYTPRYDLARYFEYLETTTLPEARLGAARENANYIAPAPPIVPFTERNKVPLNITLALLVLLAATLIGWYLFKHLRSHQPPSTSSPAAIPPNTPNPSVSSVDTSAEQPPKI